MHENPGAVQRYLYGIDLKSVLERGLCIPTALPSALDVTLSMRHDTASAFGDFCPPSRLVTSITLGNMRIPSLAGPPFPNSQDYVFPQDEPRSLRWWVVDDQTMWSGKSRIHDDLAELLSVFATWLSWIGRRTSTRNPSPERREREFLSGVRLLHTAIERKYARESRAQTEHYRSLMTGLPPEEECSFFGSWVNGRAFPLSITLLTPSDT